MSTMNDTSVDFFDNDKDKFKFKKDEDVCLKDLREALKKAAKAGLEVELLTAAPPPAGRPPNITGVIKRVNRGTIEVMLTSGPPNRIGVFSICHIIGFVPKGSDEEQEAAE
ncbi:hypothetical protein [Thermosediminibacter litoriperuensis]|uniref:Uncharacterized protein n=1 Tax=Thermosediminibacter litoriperuensis TaxID=291989 RepID=A0A5S5AXH5_9FIRM|nr:hypothetical protein [Thermosediminibacter litoriperuensis]TYP58560.1 hypothetical protein LZ11_00406 [Thermosediminibacter litoriperuensis]